MLWHFKQQNLRLKVRKKEIKQQIKHLEDSIFLISPSPTFSQMGVPPFFVHVNQQTQEHPYDATPLLSHETSSKFEMKVLQFISSRCLMILIGTHALCHHL
jgi:hypothetical protein